MPLLSPDAMHLIGQHGYGAVALAVGVESIGIPFPGETMLIAAALYAGTMRRLAPAAHSATLRLASRLLGHPLETMRSSSPTPRGERKSDFVRRSCT